MASPESSSTTRSTGDAFNLEGYKQAKEDKKLVDWVKSEQERARQERSQRTLQWYTNMSFFFGKQWVEPVRHTEVGGYRDKLMTPNRPYYAKRKTINRTRSLVRAELSKFVSQTPNAVAVPSSAEDQDTRAAFAAEQAWQSISDAQKLRTHFTRAAWWMIVTGTGFIKTWWDNDAIDKASGEKGAIRYGHVSPFHLFVPDLREQDIEDQPFIINSYTKPLSWCKQFFGDKFNYVPSETASEAILDSGHLNLSGAAKQKDACVVSEAWIKPGGCEYLPEGGVVTTVDDNLVSIVRGFPYKHGMYPFTKFEHIPSATFYADSPLVDTNDLQKEYNTLRSEISEAGRRMARPQILAQQGSIVPSKMTNEPGLIIQYKAGYAPPQPMVPAPLPQYYVEQQDRVLADIEDISGQHEVSKGQAPAGVTAGTAINFLQEKDNQFFTPEYQSIEDGYERIAQQTIGLFVQYVDEERKIKTIGADGSFDSMMLSGSDVATGTDIRIEQGSSVGQSQAAKEAKVMDMFAMGLIPQDMALKLMEVGGAQKILDIVSVAEKKAQRENLKMKVLTAEIIAEHDKLAMEEFANAMSMGMPPETDQPGEVLPQGSEGEMEQPMIPPVIPVDDFDIHEVHIESHNLFRMGQEYENLAPEVKAQFDMHVKAHEQKVMQKALMSFLQQIPSDGSDGEGPDSMDVTTPGAPPEEGAPAGPEATMSGDGAIPAPEAGGF